MKPGCASSTRDKHPQHGELAACVTKQPGGHTGQEWDPALKWPRLHTLPRASSLP